MESPLLAPFDLNSEILLKVHVPVCVVSVSAHKGFNFPSCVTSTRCGSCTREIRCKAVPHLVKELFAPLFSHLKRGTKVKTSFLLGVRFVGFVRVLCTVTFDRCFSWLPDVQLLRCRIIQHDVKVKTKKSLSHTLPAILVGVGSDDERFFVENRFEKVILRNRKDERLKYVRRTNIDQIRRHLS